MKNECRAFRLLLETKLVGKPGASDLSQLAWHEHLLACEDCRRMLESEEALEELLATLPNPKLSPLLTARVLARLRAVHAEDAALEALLERARTVGVPNGLAQRVLARLEDERKLARAGSTEERLDALLDADRPIASPNDLGARVQRGLATQRAASADARFDRLLDRDEVAAPTGLAERVIAALEAERGAKSVRAARFAQLRSRWIYAAAATILAALVAWLAWPKRSESKTPEFAHTTPRASVKSVQPDDQMLAALPVLENWERLEQVDVLLSTLDPADEAVLDYQDVDTTPAPPSQPKEPEAPSKG